MDHPVPTVLARELEDQIRGEVYLDRLHRLIYSSDASLYEMTPTAVILPRDREDILRAVRLAARHGIPLLARGAGTSLAGQTVTRGLVLDCSRYLGRILEIDPAGAWVEVEPGVVLDQLNQFLRPRGLHFAPDVATSSRANIGGMIGNNSAGVRSIRYGKTIDHVLETSVILSSGEALDFGPLTPAELELQCQRRDREGELYRRVRRIIRENEAEIRERFPKVMRRVGGYNLDALLPPAPFNLSKLMVGSEGTLGVLTRARLKLEPLPRARLVSVLDFDDLMEAISAVPRIVGHHPSAVEILDAYALKLARTNPAVAGYFREFVPGHPQAILIVEFSGDDSDELEAAVEAMRRQVPAASRCHTLREATTQQRVWQVRKSALGVLLSTRGDAKPLPFIEDSSVPVEHLAEYIGSVLEVCRRRECRVAMYAHASAGVIHVRPLLNLKLARDVEKLEKISEEVFQLVRHYGGAWSGEHGDGLVRSYKNREFFGPRLYQAFRDLKRAFDPLGLMNPGKIVDAPHLTQNLRIHPGYRARTPQTYFHFRQDRGMDRAIEMCTGVGHCRKLGTGTMCPSYMATLSEEHSTRGRANALRMAMTGRLGPHGWSSPELFRVLDLCLECKACKSECPSNVDMARLKSEFLAHYYARHGLPLGKRLFAALPQTCAWASRAPRLCNFLGRAAPLRRLLERAAGIDRRRPLPPLARVPFSRLKRRVSRAVPGGGPRAVLFIDTFTEYFQPRVGRAAERLLQRLGYQVELLRPGCCGRPLISTGRLRELKARIPSLLTRLLPYARQNVPIVVLEPSCLTALVDDWPDLAQDQEAALQVADSVTSLEALLGSTEALERLARAFSSDVPLLYHGHCQERAVRGVEASHQLFARLVTRLLTPDVGCCGMAGSFGYETAHYRISEQIGRRLFEAIRQAPEGTCLVAAGFSCRHQIEHFTGRLALHPAEVLAAGLEKA